MLPPCSTWQTPQGPCSATAPCPPKLKEEVGRCSSSSSLQALDRGGGNKCHLSEDTAPQDCTTSSSTRATKSFSFEHPTRPPEMPLMANVLRPMPPTMRSSTEQATAVVSVAPLDSSWPTFEAWPMAGCWFVGSLTGPTWTSKQCSKDRTTYQSRQKVKTPSSVPSTEKALFRFRPNEFQGQKGMAFPPLGHLIHCTKQNPTFEV